MIRVDWKENFEFEATNEVGQTLTLDAYPSEGGVSAGMTPVQALLASAAACSAMDVVSILEKKQQVWTAYRVEIEGDRGPEGAWPRPFTFIRVRHIVTGPDLDRAAVERAVQLSDEKYCSVLATLRVAVDVTSSLEVEK